jgi:hypothetical protein
MGRVHLVQYLCSERHCVAAVAYRRGEGSYENTVAGLKAMLKSAGANPWCGICGSRDLHFEEGATPFDTWRVPTGTAGDATPELLRAQEENLRSREILDALGLTHDTHDTHDRSTPGDIPRV